MTDRAFERRRYKRRIEPARLVLRAAELWLLAGLSACSSSQPLSLPTLAGPSPPADPMDSPALGTKPTGALAPGAGTTTPAGEAGQPTAGTSPPTQITGFHSGTVILYTSDVGADGQKVPVNTLSLPLPIAAISPSK